MFNKYKNLSNKYLIKIKSYLTINKNKIVIKIF